MKREILCPKCGADYYLLHVDRQRGFQMRRTEIPRVKTPPGLGISTVTMEHGQVTDSEYQPRYEIHCDICDGIVPEGTPVLAATTWNVFREGEPENWEKEYTQ